MKAFLIVLVLLIFNSASVSFAAVDGSSCINIQAGGDAWPWSVAKPFPWDNIQGYWKLGDDQSSYLSARVLSTTKNRKILSLSVLGEGLCSKAYAKGTGYVDVTEKNVVRALVSDGVYKYQLKLGMFDSRDLVTQNSCSPDVMAVSMQVIARAKKSNDLNLVPLDPKVTETINMVLKKVTLDVDTACKKIN